MKNLMAEGLRGGQVIAGVCNMYPASGIIEGMCKGWDFVWIDGQHGQFSYDSVLHALQAASALRIDTLLRVPGHEPGVIGLYADLAPSAIMVPMVNNAEMARGAVESLRFPPLGKRSYGGRRVIDLYGRDYYRETEVLLVAQIETVESVGNLDEIAAVPGVDMLFFGPDDMKVQMGIPVNTPMTENDVLREAMIRTAKAAREAGKFCGCVAPTPAAAEMLISMGYQLLVSGGDIVFLRTLSASRLSEIRGILEGLKGDASVKREGIYG